MVRPVLRPQLDSGNSVHPQARAAARHHLLLLHHARADISSHRYGDVRLASRQTDSLSSLPLVFNVALGNLSAYLHAALQFLPS